MKIDIHAHYFPAEYLERLERCGAGHLTGNIRRSGVVSSAPGDLDAWVATMDAAGLEMQVLSLASQAPCLPNEAVAVETARFGNELYADIVRRYPKRFAALACTPLPHVEAAINEAGYALDELGMAGVTATTSVLGKSIADAEFEPFFAELNRRTAVLLLHPIGSSAGSPVIENSKLTWPIGAPLEDTICLLQLMQAGVPERFPDLRIILPHLGGFAPFVMERLDHMKARFLPPSAPAPSEQAKFFWYDTVGAQTSALRGTEELVGSDRLLLGTDYPFWRGEALRKAVEYVEKSGLPAPQIARIQGGNAEQLLGLKVAA